MGIMKEKLEAVINEWNKEEDLHQAIQEKTYSPLSRKIIDFVLKYPNSPASNIQNIIMREYPDTPKSSVSSSLKQLTDKNFLEREEFFDPTICRTSFKYRVISEQKRLELEAIRKAEEQASEERLEKMRAQAEVARAAKAAKREERLKVQKYEDTGISAALPTPKRNGTQEILDSLSITQARALYDELKKIFGG